MAAFVSNEERPSTQSGHEQGERRSRMCAINMMVANGFRQTDHTGGIVPIGVKRDTPGAGRLPPVVAARRSAPARLPRKQDGVSL